MAFLKGKSGNPGGRTADNVGGYNLPQVCRIKSHGTADFVAKIAADESAPLNARLRAIEMLWDRGYGKATQAVAEVPVIKKEPMHMTDEEIEAELDLLRRKLGLIDADGNYSLNNMRQ
jgi:hypothetical protein